jgi:hypothetical protein
MAEYERQRGMYPVSDPDWDPSTVMDGRCWCGQPSVKDRRDGGDGFCKDHPHPPKETGRVMKIVVTHDDGTEIDITTLVQVAYDVSTHSMDWGSGFLDQEEVDGLVLLAVACRFPDTTIDEVWVKYHCEGMTWGEREAFGRERGHDHAHQVHPTPEEREAFIHDLMSKYTPAESS